MKSRVILRVPDATDRSEFLAAVRASVELHRPWVFPPSTAPAYREYLKRCTQEQHLGFLVLERASGRIAGVINISNIVLGSLRSGYLGYYAFAGFERRGFTTEGLRAVIRLAFKDLKLHRLEANIQPANQSSLALVKSCGFEREGFSKRYLKIQGRWRDHERWAIRAS